MAEFSRTLDEELRVWMDKLQKSLLPPDPARTVEAILRIPTTVEHILPIPPIIEKLHNAFTEKLIESLPRLPLTGDYPITEWLKWRKE